MATVVKIGWNPNKENETKITLTEAFSRMTKLEKLDALKDSIGCLTSIYDDLLADTTTKLTE